MIKDKIKPNLKKYYILQRNLKKKKNIALH